jgi:transcriptional regulator with XRE-family HTH domain
MTEPKRNPTQITDPTGRAVADNVRRYREGLALSTYQLSKLLADAGRTISPSAIAKIERAERRVDVGDLMALAVALHVTPISLLLPRSAKGSVEITGGGTVDGRQAWKWAQGRDLLRYPASADKEQRERLHVMYLLRVAPQGIGWDTTTGEGQHAAFKALKDAFGEGMANGPGVD